ncbi:indole-3-glycerol phosphate synthase TrpC [soil metagenome]
MATILDQILSDTRRLVVERRCHTPASSLVERDAYGAPRRSLVDALRAPGLSIIAESKQASPSQGVIRPEYDPASIAVAYEKGGASAVSVLTEPTHFLGSLDHLEAARAAVSLPLLRKDFVIDPYQITEARAFGADAILLIASALERSHLEGLRTAAVETGLEVLLEIHDVRELDRIDLALFPMIGVNNRDLRTFEVDLQQSLDVFGLLPAEVVRVTESGLKSAADLAAMARGGADAALIGEAFMRADDPGHALKELISETRTLLDHTEISA